MLKRLLPAIALAAGLAAAPAQAQPFSFVALGDMPYTLPADYAKFDRLIAAINAVAPAFSIHIGDIKSGSTRCSDEIVQKVFDPFAPFEQPLIYTPGDNEWTDCHRQNNGAMDPLERLARIRAMFFAEPTASLGKTRLPVESQARVMPDRFATFVENQRWSHNGVMFATVHVVGSNNNFEPRPGAPAEYAARNAANVAWIDDTFAKARAAGSKAVVLAWQAQTLDITTPYGVMPLASGFTDTIEAVARGARDVPGPVLVIHGDEHEFQVGVFKDTKLKPIANVVRLEVFGATHVHAVKVLVDPDSPGVFGFVPLMVKENGRY
jgi:hypothetical protein